MKTTALLKNNKFRWKLICPVILTLLSHAAFANFYDDAGRFGGINDFADIIPASQNKRTAPRCGSVLACPSGTGYTVTQITGATIVPGTTQLSNGSVDATTLVTLPFTYNFYDQSFNAVTVSSNGNLQFSSNSNSNSNSCLPASSLNNAIMPYWDILRTSGGGTGIFTSISGTAPNRIFNIEWRACIRNSPFACSSIDTNFEVRLYEGIRRFDFIYGSMIQNGSGATVGVQRDTGTNSCFTQFSCNTASLSNGLMLTFISPLPTAASVSVSGRILTPDNRGLRNARISISNDNGNTRTVISNAFGYYHFENVEVGQTYIFTVFSKRYQFAPQAVSVMEEINELNFRTDSIQPSE